MNKTYTCSTIGKKLNIIAIMFRKCEIKNLDVCQQSSAPALKRCEITRCPHCDSLVLTSSKKQTKRLRMI